jgi:hypothetical protein
MKIKDFKKMLDEFDWYYRQSDDNRVYDRGYNQERAIKEAMKDNEKLTKLYNEAKPSSA